MQATGIAAIIAFGLSTVVLAGQGTQGLPQPPPRFRTGIDVIQLDVTVLDGRRRPVRGLTAADFTVLEDGKPQPIVGFAEIVVPEPETPPAAWMRDVAPDVRTNDIPVEGRLIVLVMDDATVPPVAQIVASAKDVARKVVESMGPHDLVSVVFTQNNRHSQDFTANRAQLLEAIARYAPAFAWHVLPKEDGQTECRFADDSLTFLYSIGTLRRAAEYLRDIPRRKKTLIYISVGIPVDPVKASTPFNIGASGARIGDTTIHIDMLREMQHTFGQALGASVNIYGVDPGGLGGMEAFLLGCPINLMQARQMAGLQLDFLRTVSDNTGGRAVVDTNDFQRPIDEILRENSSYYIVGYQTPNLAQDGKYRRLDVRVNRPGLTVQARKGYVVAKPRKADAKQRDVPPLATAMAGFLPKGDVRMVAATAPFDVTGRKESALAIVARVRLPAATTRRVDRTELQTTVFTPQGKTITSRRHTADVVLVPTDATAAEYEVLARIDVKPGRYQLGIAAHNPALGKSGSVYYDVDVPDFSKDGLWLSGLVLGTRRGFPAAPPDAFVGLLPFLPTTRREFDPGDEAFAFVRIYQRGRKALEPASVSVRVVDRSGRTVDRVDDIVAAERFSKAGAADYRFNLPLSILAPGPHLLSIEAKAGGKSVRRDVRFVKTAARSGG